MARSRRQAKSLPYEDDSQTGEESADDSSDERYDTDPIEPDCDEHQLKDNDDVAQPFADNEHSPDYYLQQLAWFDESAYRQEDYSKGTLVLLDQVEARWKQYVLSLSEIMRPACQSASNSPQDVLAKDRRYLRGYHIIPKSSLSLPNHCPVIKANVIHLNCCTSSSCLGVVLESISSNISVYSGASNLRALSDATSNPSGYIPASPQSINQTLPSWPKIKLRGAISRWVRTSLSK